MSLHEPIVRVSLPRHKNFHERQVTRLRLGAKYKVFEHRQLMQMDSMSLINRPKSSSWEWSRGCQRL